MELNIIKNGFGDVLGVVFSIISSLFPFIIGILVLIAVANASQGDKLSFGPEGKQISKDVPYYRDIPCNKDIFRAYYIGYNYGLLKNKTDILGAIILKWIKDGVVRIEQRTSSGLMHKQETVIILNDTNPETIQNVRELKMFKILYEASKDGILESKEFEKWCSKYYSRVLSWFDANLIEQKEKLVAEGLITVESKTTFKVFKSVSYTATPELKQEACKLAGLKRYLKDYTLIKDRQAIEVTLFEEYLIYAQLMGIAKEVAKEFKDLYPDLIAQSNFDSYDNIIFINYCAANGISSANSARARAESYSSGGGGFSSGGGGGGSFGGGGGGRWIPLIKKYHYGERFLALV